MKYVQLRHYLTQIFIWNHCSDPEGLTDEVFDRVARKVHELRKTFVGDPRLYFYAVARNLIKEQRNKARVQVPLDEADLTEASQTTNTAEETTEMLEECLDSCLQKLKRNQRELILAYYAKERHAKIENRRDLAGRLNISLETLRVRALRIRRRLEQCTNRCFGRKMQGK